MATISDLRTAYEALQNDALAEALTAYAAQLPSLTDFLGQRGVSTPDGSEVTIEVTAGKDPPDKCVKICYKGGLHHLLHLA